MSKKKKATLGKNGGKKQQEDADGANPKAPMSEVIKEKQRICVRAIRITPEILEAAKQMKKDKGISFYRLGLEAISDRLIKEGYLKEAAKTEG